MTAFPTYETGTVQIDADATSIVGTGTTWTGNSAFPGDTIEVDGFGPIKIVDVTDATHLTIKPWPFAAVPAGTAYAIFKDSLQRFTAVQQAQSINDLIAQLHASGLMYYLDPAWTDPNLAKPSISGADDGQAILRISTGQLWVKQGGVWVAAGTFKGFNFTGAYDGAASYNINDVLTSDGSAYVVIAPTTGNAPPNATYYSLLASKGDTGAKGDKGDKGDTGPAGADGTGTGTVQSVTVGGTTVTTTGTLPAVAYDAVQSLTSGEQAQARANIGAAKSDANSDITSLSGLTTALSVAQGGTGDTGTAWTSYTPTVAVTGGAGTATGRFKRIGKTVFISVTVNVTSAGSFTAISLRTGITAANVSGISYTLVGRENALTGAAWIGLISANGTIIDPLTVSNTHTVAVGASVTLSGVFETN
jgi:hypothetical protein